MVTEIYSAQLKWFTQTLIKMRVIEDGYGSSIEFDPRLIESCSVPFNTVNKSSEEHVIRMLKEIRNFLIENKLVSIGELFWKKTADGHLEIDGYTSRLLRAYFDKTFEGSSCLFGEAQNEKGNPVLTFNGQPTKVPIRGNSLAVFRSLKRNFGKDVTFEKLYASIRDLENLTQERSLRRGSPLTRKEIGIVQSAISELREKLKTATRYAEFPEIIENVRGVGYKMVV